MTDDLKARFEQASVDVKGLSKRPSDNDMLASTRSTSRRPRATCPATSPASSTSSARAKYEAWEALQGTSAEGRHAALHRQGPRARRLILVDAPEFRHAAVDRGGLPPGAVRSPAAARAARRRRRASSRPRRPVVAEPARLAAYREVCELPDDGRLPLTYPHVLAGGVHMAMLLHPEFPVRMVGMVHLTNDIELFRPIPATPGWRSIAGSRAAAASRAATSSGWSPRRCGTANWPGGRR
jgi:acyl-CoA-binding protein